MKKRRVMIAVTDGQQFKRLSDLLSLEKSFSFEPPIWIYKADVIMEVVTENNFDLLLLEYPFDGEDLLGMFQNQNPSQQQFPVVLLLDRINPEVETEVLKYGISECVLKEDIEAVLPRAIRYTLERKRIYDVLWEETEKILYQTGHDTLTGLINRSHFGMLLHQMTVNARTNPIEHTLLFLDLDQFKIINISCGHFAGDQLLKQIGMLLVQIAGPNAIVARMGGDEFAILFPETDRRHAVEMAEKICQTIRDFRFIWNGAPFSIGVSIGVVSISGNNGSGDHLLNTAEQLCYMSKAKGGNRIYLYQDEDPEFLELHDEVQWVSLITRAFDENRFRLYYQPIKSAVKVKKEEQFEILIRMMDEDGKIIYPKYFLPAAQKFNLMPSIDRWVITTFFSFFQSKYLVCEPHYCSINLSGASLNDDSFLDFIKDQFRQYQIPPHNICFEITETIAIANLTKAVRLIQELKGMGCRFSLDDFGSGQASFNYLKHLPVDYVKIDGAFIVNLLESPFDSAMVKTINQLGHLANMQTVAEFVESKAIYKKLKHIGVDYVQGNWIAKPKPLY